MADPIPLIVEKDEGIVIDRKVSIGEIYQHYRNEHYYRITELTMCVHAKEPRVSYQRVFLLGNEWKVFDENEVPWSRLLKSFNFRYNNGLDRFTLIDG